MATQDSIQKVPYSLSLRANPLHEDDPKKVFANLQQNGTVSLNQLARHIKEHGSPYGRDVVLGVLTAIVDCTREFLVQGFRVDLGDLGSFEPSIRQEGADTFDEFSQDNIKEYRAIYSMSSAFDNMRKDVVFQRVATRKAQAAIVDAENQGSTSADWTATEDGGSSSGGGSAPEPEP